MAPGAASSCSGCTHRFFYTTREYRAESSKETDAPATPRGCNGRILKLEPWTLKILVLVVTNRRVPKIEDGDSKDIREEVFEEQKT